MNQPRPISDELIAAAFEQRSRRGDVRDVRAVVLATASTTAQQRSWRMPTTWFGVRPVVRLAVTGLLIAMLLATILLIGSRIERALPVVQFRWSATGDGQGMYFSKATGGGIAIDPTGLIWVADTGRGRFAIFRPDGSFVEYWDPAAAGVAFDLTRIDGDGYGTLAFGPDGSFYVLDTGNRRVVRFDSAREVIRTWGGETDRDRYLSPVGIAVDQVNGDVLVLDDQRDLVETSDLDGNFLHSFQAHTGGRNTVRRLSLDRHGQVYVGVSTATGGEVRKFDSSGRLTVTVATDEPDQRLEPGGMAVDAADRLFVARGPFARYDKVDVFDPAGKVVTSFGAPGSGDGQFGFGIALGLAIDRVGGVYVTDAALNRVEKFQLPPELIP